MKIFTMVILILMGTAYYFLKYKPSEELRDKLDLECSAKHGTLDSYRNNIFTCSDGNGNVIFVRRWKL